MNEAVATLHMLCRLLRPPGAPATLAPANGLATPGDRWKAVIELANASYLTPALWLAVRRNGPADLLPGDAREFLAQACRLNRARNERIREQAVELIAALNEAEISSVVLKGGACLFAGDPDAFDTRMMVDLDLLVAQEHLAESFEIAGSMGYRVLVEYDPRLHQLDPIGREGDAASVELHRDAGMQRRILPAEDVFREAVAIEYEGTRVLIPSPTHRAIHGIFHSEVQWQSNYALGRIPLRYLHDLSLLRCRHDAEIDWEQVQESLARQGYGHLVPGFLYLADRLLGLPMPDAIPVTAAAKRHYDWCMAQVRWPALRASVSVWGVVTHPFRRPPVEYIYGEHRGPVTLQINRLRYARDLGKQHKGGSLAKLSNIFRRMFRA